MGCFWSSESSRDRELEQRRQLASLLSSRDRRLEQEQRRQLASLSAPPRSSRSTPFNARPQACYGEYTCICGRHWNSRLSWPDSFQICKRCKRRVYPRAQRPLLPSDMREAKENVKEHENDLCQKCQQLGHYCGKGKNSNTRKRY